jgi:hypothetical protein
MELQLSNIDEDSDSFSGRAAAGAFLFIALPILAITVFVGEDEQTSKPALSTHQVDLSLNEHNVEFGPEGSAQVMGKSSTAQEETETLGLDLDSIPQVSDADSSESVDSGKSLRDFYETDKTLIEIAEEHDNELRSLGARVSVDPDGVYAKWHYKMPDDTHIVCERGFLYGQFHHSCKELYPGTGQHTPEWVKPFPGG